MVFSHCIENESTCLILRKRFGVVGSFSLLENIDQICHGCTFE